jgi:hypothetical protein
VLGAAGGAVTEGQVVPEDRDVQPDLREHPMTEAPISPLRRRMIEDMTIRKFAP